MKRLLGFSAIALTLCVIGAMVGIRLSGHDVERWHVDPTAAPTPDSSNWFGAGRGFDVPAPVFDVETGILSSTFDRIALADARTEIIADDRLPTTSSGGTQTPQMVGHVTFVQRSAVFGFPDYISVRFLPAGDRSQSTLSIFSRSRFGQSDFGVNQARVERWLAELAAQLPTVSTP